MALPAIGDGEQIGDGNTNETLNVGRAGQPVVLQASATGTLGFWAATPTTQPTNAAQAALTLTTATSAGFGFSTSAGFNAFIAQLENIRASLVTIGILKGS